MFSAWLPQFSSYCMNGCSTALKTLYNVNTRAQHMSHASAKNIKEALLDPDVNVFAKSKHIAANERNPI